MKDKKDTEESTAAFVREKEMDEGYIEDEIIKSQKEGYKFVEKFFKLMTIKLMTFKEKLGIIKNSYIKKLNKIHNNCFNKKLSLVSINASVEAEQSSLYELIEKIIVKFKAISSI